MQVCCIFAANIWLASWEKGPYLPRHNSQKATSKFVKSRHVNPEVDLFAAFDLIFWYIYIVYSEFQYGKLAPHAWKEYTKNFQVKIRILLVKTFM